MTTLLIHTETIPLTVELPFMVQMTHEQFYQFYAANPDLRIERNGKGEVIIMPPTFSDAGMQKAPFAPICPNFVIELRSTRDMLKGLQEKMQEYIENGASL